jgi:hypothetical protein
MAETPIPSGSVSYVIYPTDSLAEVSGKSRGKGSFVGKAWRYQPTADANTGMSGRSRRRSVDQRINGALREGEGYIYLTTSASPNSPQTTFLPIIPNSKNHDSNSSR